MVLKNEMTFIYGMLSMDIIEEQVKSDGSKTMFDIEAYDEAVNASWEKLDKAQTNEELQEVLDAWPELKSFEIAEEEPKDDTDYAV